MSGRGEAFKAGGKVVKNVTGYDLPKIFAGSYGTLGVLNEVTVKVMPRPELTQTLIATIDDIADGFDVLRGIMRGDYEVSGLALLPCVLSPNGKSSLLIRLEGTPKSVAARKQNLLAHVGLTQVDVLDYDPWYQLGHGAYLQKSPTLWRISLPPARVMTLVAQLDDNTWYADWAGGRLFWTGDVSDDAGAARLRTLLGGQGHAMLVRADAGLRAAVAVFEPMPAGLVALSRQIKAQFDPMAVLNPGRMGF